jgi:hypothetical protein
VKAICASRGQPPATLRRDAMTFTLSPKEAIFAALVSAALHSWLNDPTLETSDEILRSSCAMQPLTAGIT